MEKVSSGMTVEQAAKAVFNIFKRNMPQAAVNYKIKNSTLFTVFWSFGEIEFDLDIMDPDSGRADILMQPAFKAAALPEYFNQGYHKDCVKALDNVSVQLKAHLAAVEGAKKALAEVKAMTLKRP